MKIVRNSYFAFLLAINLVHPSLGLAQSAGDVLSGPNSTPETLEADAEEKDDVLDIDRQDGFDAWKSGLKERTGLDFGFDYNALGFLATDSLGKDRSGSGSFRIFGTWELLNRGSPNSGSLVFKFENRHRYGSVAPTDFGGELGYVGLPSSVFSDQGNRVTHLYWEQNFADGLGVSYIGWLDVTDYTDVYALASPWTGFENLAFQTGSGSIGGLPDGALGAMVGGFLSDNYYAAASFADANADPTDPLEGFDTLFDDGETFKTFEFGWTSGGERLFVDNAHVTFWQIDERGDAGTPDGHGVSFSYTRGIDDTWLPFLRGGWAEDGGSLYEASLSAGFGYTQEPGRNLLGVGLNWSRPNDGTFGSGLDDQYTLEAFQRWQITQGVAITPSVQIIHNPAFNPDDDTIALFGLRIRAAF